MLPVPHSTHITGGNMRTTTKKITALFLFAAASAAHAGDVNVGVSVGGQVAPGVYGRVDIGNTPPPVVYAQPIMVMQPPRAVAVAPVYMHVPPGHAKKWSKHCHKYNACAQPVYFVQSAEYGGGKHKHKKHKHDD